MPKGICYNASRQERRKCSLWHAKSPGVATSGAFLFRCGKVAYALGWLPPIYLRPAICRCSRRLAKKLNENGYVDYKQELPNTMKEVREVWQLLKQYLQKQA